MCEEAGRGGEWGGGLWMRGSRCRVSNLKNGHVTLSILVVHPHNGVGAGSGGGGGGECEGEGRGPRRVVTMSHVAYKKALCCIFSPPLF